MKNLPNVLLTAGAIVTIAGALMKIMHYAGGSEVLLAGLAFGAIAFMMLAFKKSRTA